MYTNDFNEHIKEIYQFENNIKDFEIEQNIDNINSNLSRE